MKVFGIISGREFPPYKDWQSALQRTHTIIVTPNDAEFEKSNRESK